MGVSTIDTGLLYLSKQGESNGEGASGKGKERPKPSETDKMTKIR